MSFPEAQPIPRDEQAAMWCLRVSDGDMAPSEEAAFDNWLADPNNLVAFEEATSIWQLSLDRSETLELIGMRSAALEDYRRAAQARWRWPSAVTTRWKSALAVAMASAAALLVAAFYQPAQVFETHSGERRIAMLADGSRLSLDGDTEVDVRFGKYRRELQLVRGRAKFDVAKDPLRPFAVRAGGGVVVATGTSFSVEILERKIHVLLYEGHVAVLKQSDNRPLPQDQSNSAANADRSLLPGKELVADLDGTGAARVKSVDPELSIGWEAGRLNFNDEPLDSAIERVNRYSKKKIVIANNTPRDLRISGTFDAGDVSAFLEGVAAVDGLQARDGDTSITLQKKN